MIRRATVEDAGAIAQIHVRTWQTAYAGIVPADYLAALSEEKRTAFWRQSLSLNREIVLVAQDGDTVVAWASGGLSRDADAAGAAEIYAIYVSPAFWRRDLGRRLMNALEAELPGTAGLILWVLPENRGAIRFYEKLGYRYDGAKKEGSFGSIKLAEVRYRKEKLA